MVRTDKTLDIKGVPGTRCEIITETTLAGMESGQILTVVATDRSVRKKLAELCQRLGYMLLDIREEGGAVNIQIQR